jgi:membrane peptidoglycan carboxypeptidase
MLTAVVQHGTGTMAQIPGYLVGGKTGTARVPRTDRLGYSNDIITTFAGMAPADDPRLVVMVQLHNPSIRYAATTAAPVFREIMRFALGARGIAPTVGLADTEALSLRRAVAPPPPKRKHHDRRDPLARVETVAEAPPARAGPEEAAKQP